MNAINRLEPGDPASGAAGFADARRARQLRQLERLGELGMALAEVLAAQALAAQALAELAAAEAADPAPRVSEARLVQPAHAVEPASDRAASGPGDSADASGLRRLDPSLGFARVSRAVCQAIALEARIAAGEIGVAPRRPGATMRDLGLGMIRRVLRAAAADAEPDTDERIALFSMIREQLDAIKADAADEPPAADIIVSVCDQFRLALDPDKLPAEVFYLLRNEAPRVLQRSGGPDPP